MRACEVVSLTRNYRSVQGVLDLSRSVVELLEHFFPDRIDRMPRETANAASIALPVVIAGLPIESALKFLAAPTGMDHI